MILLPAKNIFVSSSLDKKLFVWNYTASDVEIYNFTSNNSITKLVYNCLFLSIFRQE